MVVLIYWLIFLLYSYGSFLCIYYYCSTMKTAVVQIPPGNIELCLLITLTYITCLTCLGRHYRKAISVRNEGGWEVLFSLLNTDLNYVPLSTPINHPNRNINTRLMFQQPPSLTKHSNNPTTTAGSINLTEMKNYPH